MALRAAACPTFSPLDIWHINFDVVKGARLYFRSVVDKYLRLKEEIVELSHDITR
jgi:hypothetical protein